MGRRSEASSASAMTQMYANGTVMQARKKTRGARRSSSRHGELVSSVAPPLPSRREAQLSRNHSDSRIDSSSAVTSVTSARPVGVVQPLPIFNELNGSATLTPSAANSSRRLVPGTLVPLNERRPKGQFDRGLIYLSVVSIFFFPLIGPFALLAAVISRRRYNTGNNKAGKCWSTCSKVLFTLSFGLGMAIVMMVIIRLYNMSLQSEEDPPCRYYCWLISYWFSPSEVTTKKP